MCYSLVIVWKGSRKLFGCVGPQVRSHRTKERKGNTDGSAGAETELHSQGLGRQTFTNRGYKSLMKIICMRRGEVRDGGWLSVSALSIIEVIYITAVM